MKKVSKIFVLCICVLGLNKVSAMETNYIIVNDNGIEITDSEYQNLLNIGFTDNEIFYMTLEEYNSNKNLNGEVVSKNTVYLDKKK